MIVWTVQVYRVNRETGRPDFNEVLSERAFLDENKAYGYEAVHNREHFYNHPWPATSFAFVTGQTDTGE